ncbi:MAG: RIP metalloprotease RseP [Gemmatimonadota bacterium]
MVTTILATALVLGVLIFVHELGHFWAAKAVDIEVHRFAIGFGPKLFGFTRGETEYLVAAIPFGGYVKMAGMGEEEALAPLEGPAAPVERAPSPRDFDAKPLWARVVVVSAGVVMNLLFAFAAFSAYARVQGMRVPIVGQVVPGSPAEAAGLLPGDRILSVEGVAVRDFSEVTMSIEPRAGEELTLTVARGGRTLELLVRPDSAMIYSEVLGDSVVIGQIGVARDPSSFRLLGWGQALVEGMHRTGYWTRSIVDFVIQLVTGHTSARELGGPILIGQLSGQFARLGLWPFLNFMAIISINLAVLNLLPIPVLDGGHLLFLAVEGVRGRALSVEQRMRLTQVGLVLIVGLMVWAFANDILRIIP